MPSWVNLVLVITGCVAVVALQAAAGAGRWREAWVALRQFTLYLLLLALPALVAYLVITA